MDENSHHTPIHQGTQAHVFEVTGFWKNSLGLQLPHTLRHPRGWESEPHLRDRRCIREGALPSAVRVHERSNPASRRYKDEGGLACGNLPVTNTRPIFQFVFFF